MEIEFVNPRIQDLNVENCGWHTNCATRILSPSWKKELLNTHILTTQNPTARAKFVDGNVLVA